ncbi:alpha/beta hydrolase [Aerobium aerolatum]|uniref:alpha/beta hydrolase n=1 Tax=Aerobium aerolatum TaxID=561088 RepID=UPI000B881078|nr:alpha/beta-hydrolase family protein [Aquamicrobium aerolatum]
MVQTYLVRLSKSLCTIGLLVGTLFFAASLTPSLLPRSFQLQGALSGFSFASGYLVGVFARWVWHYLEMPAPSARVRRWALGIASAFCAAVVLVVLWKASEWQDSVRLLMGMQPVEGSRPLEVGLIAALVFLVLLGLARLFNFLFDHLSLWLQKHIPRRVSNVIGIAILVSLVWTAVDGILFQSAIRAADRAFQNLDARIESNIARPTDPMKTGSPASLLDWEALGRAGRDYVATGPSATEISAFTGKPALEPLRVFAGLNSAPTANERAALALEELKRVGAFERSVLVVATPTGTGWLDPSAVDTLEYLHHGDVATVAVQYSYLASWLSLLIEPAYGAETAEALFNTVYQYWTKLPHDQRPRLYLYGLSLGALNSSRSVEIYDMIGDPFHGALWSGPPFSTQAWRSATARREEGSPAWLPHFRDGSAIRFANQFGGAASRTASWGPMRIVYLQYASDPIVFFDRTAPYREPAWMEFPRGPDVSPSLVWFPIVSVLQLGLDMALATTTPMGHGHVYAPEHHVEPWIEVTQPPAWSAAELAALKQHLRARRELQIASGLSSSS